MGQLRAICPILPPIINIRQKHSHTFVAIRTCATHSTALLGSRSILLRTFSGEMSGFTATVASLALWGLRAISGKVTGFCYHVSTKFVEDAPSHRKGSPHLSSTSRGRGVYGCSCSFTHVSHTLKIQRKHFPLSDERKIVQLRGKGRYAEALTILGIPWGNHGPIQTHASV